MEYSNEIVISSVGAIATGIAYVVGAHKRAKSKQVDSVTDGAQKVVDSSLRLLKMVETNLQAEQDHRERCERQVEALTKQIKDIRRQIHSNNKQTR
jgi:vacuolar-type H+-ATPase subunit I/STV1